ncbi:MAG: ATP-binding protein [Bdellovibrionales bacterium]
MKEKVLAHLYEPLANEAMFGIVVFDQDGVSFYTNRMAEQMLGTTKLKLDDLAPDPTQGKGQFIAFSNDLFKHDGLYQDILVKSPNGRNFIANVGVRAMEVDSEPVRIIMMQDVTLQKKLQREITAKQTEIKAAYEELLQQNRQLKDLDVAKDRFIAITTHELRTPLSAMVASAEILKMGLFDTPEQMKEFIEIIHDQGIHLQDLVNDILDFAKIRAGKMDFYIEQHELGEFVQGILRNYEDMAQSSQITIEFEKPEAPLNCYFDEVRLRQVVSNIVSNGIKYNRSGGKLTVKIETAEGMLRATFKDSGKGIAKENFDKVFNEFETIGNVAQHHKGTGLGMPISRKLIEGMGGRLDFDSELGVGSTFWVDIPTEKVLDPSLYRPRPEKSGDLAA